MKNRISGQAGKNITGLIGKDQARIVGLTERKAGGNKCITES